MGGILASLSIERLGEAELRDTGTFTTVLFHTRRRKFTFTASQSGAFSNLISSSSKQLQCNFHLFHPTSISPSSERLQHHFNLTDCHRHKHRTPTENRFYVANMPGASLPSKRAKYDLANTFDVLVGRANHSRQLFMLHTSVFIPRSEFFRAARSSHWLSDPQKPVDLTDEEPATFSHYMNCVYFGIGALKAASPELELEIMDQDHQGSSTQNPEKQEVPDAFTLSERDLNAHMDKALEENTQLDVQAYGQMDALVKLYLIADKLQDLTTVNIAIDEIVRFSHSTQRNPYHSTIRIAYEATTHGSPLRRLIRDFFVFETMEYLAPRIHAENLPLDFYRDVAVELLRRKSLDEEGPLSKTYDPNTVRENCRLDKCYYHQHNDKCPRCVSRPPDLDR